MYEPIFKDDAALREKYEGKRVVIAGADGFLGTNCAYGLHAVGAKVTLITRREVPRAEIPATVCRGDLSDASFTRDAVEGHDVVFNMVGFPKVSPKTVVPLAGDIEDDFVPHINLFTAAAAASTKPSVVHVSSRLVYGKPEYLPVDEKHPTVPTSVYGAHKIAIENYANVLRLTQGLRTVVIRLANPYGPNGHFTNHAYGIINMFVSKAIRGETIEIYGEGAQERDYVFVDDVVRTLLWSGVTEACVGQVFNYGGGRSIKLCEAAKMIGRIAGSKVEHVPWPGEQESIETGSFISNIEKIRSLLPAHEHMPFEAGIERTIAQAREQYKAIQGASDRGVHAESAN